MEVALASFPVHSQAGSRPLDRPLQRCIRRHATSRLFVPSRNGHPFLICRYFQPPFGLLFWTPAFGIQDHVEAICPYSQAPIEYRATFANSRPSLTQLEDDDDISIIHDTAGAPHLHSLRSDVPRAIHGLLTLYNRVILGETGTLAGVACGSFLGRLGFLE